MSRFFITGAAGFVGIYFLEYLRDAEPDAMVMAADIADALPASFEKLPYCKLNLLDEQAVTDVLAEFKPDHILHLASISSVAQSWQDPEGCFRHNSAILMNLAGAARKLQLKCRILSIGSSEEYGNVASSKMPLREDYPLYPVNPYAVAKAAQEMLSRFYTAGCGVDMLMTRSFNHIGPRQRDIFVIPSFIKQLVESAAQPGPHKLMVGNIQVVRDFLDVRDVVDAYYRILRNGRPGEVYNVCSGKGVKLADIIDTIGEILGIEVDICIDPARIRPTENMVIIGDNSKLRDELGWSIKYDLRQTIGDMIRYYRRKSF